MNAPQALSMEEWKEIMQVPAVKESWGLSGGETPEEFADMAYGVKNERSRTYGAPIFWNK
jgi:hypothetical protein